MIEFFVPPPDSKRPVVVLPAEFSVAEPFLAAGAVPLAMKKRALTQLRYSIASTGTMFHETVSGAAASTISESAADVQLEPAWHRDIRAIADRLPEPVQRQARKLLSDRTWRREALPAEKPDVRFGEGGSLKLDWLLDGRSFGVVFDPRPEDAGWYIAALPERGGTFEWGSLETLDATRLFALL